MRITPRMFRRNPTRSGTNFVPRACRSVPLPRILMNFVRPLHGMYPYRLARVDEAYGSRKIHSNIAAQRLEFTRRQRQCAAVVKINLLAGIQPTAAARVRSSISRHRISRPPAIAFRRARRETDILNGMNHARNAVKETATQRESRHQPRTRE